MEILIVFCQYWTKIGFISTSHGTSRWKFLSISLTIIFNSIHFLKLLHMLKECLSLISFLITLNIIDSDKVICLSIHCFNCFCHKNLTLFSFKWSYIFSFLYCLFQLYCLFLCSFVTSDIDMPSQLIYIHYQLISFQDIQGYHFQYLINLLQ
jgi:hypothetical protein